MKNTRLITASACALAASLASAPDAAAECSSWGAGEERGRLELLDLDEASGLARAWTGDDALWSHNDSGDQPRLYAVGADGADLGVWDVAGATARDWEDITRGPCGAGADGDCLFIADFGNNSESRDDLAIWSVPEPARPSAPLTERGLTAPATRYALAYDFDDGANPDAESLWYDHADQTLYMATKESDTARVLRVTLDAGVARLELVGQVPIARATAAAGAPAGDSFVIRNYFAAFSYSRANGESVADALAAGGAQIRLRNEGQAEAIAFNSGGDGLWTVSEGEGTPLFLYPCLDDANPGDAGADAGADAGPDAGAGQDAGQDAVGVTPDAGGSAPSDAGGAASPSTGADGGCATSPGPAPAGPLALLVGALVLGARRRRRA